MYEGYVASMGLQRMRLTGDRIAQPLLEAGCRVIKNETKRYPRTGGGGIVSGRFVCGCDVAVPKQNQQPADCDDDDGSARSLDEALSSLPSLRSLSIKRLSLSCPPVAALARLTALTSLELEGARLGPLSIVSALTALQSLRVDLLCDPSDCVPVEVLAALSALTRLELRDDAPRWMSPSLPPPVPLSLSLPLQCSPTTLLPKLLPKLATLRSGRLAASLLAHPGALPSLTHLLFYPNSAACSGEELIRRRLPTLASLTLLRSRNRCTASAAGGDTASASRSAAAAEPSVKKLPEYG
jgi:hypothetical protein